MVNPIAVTAPILTSSLHRGYKYLTKEDILFLDSYIQHILSYAV